MAQNIWDEENWPQITKQIHLERESWTVSQVINELLALPPMPDEDDNLWDYTKTWYEAEVFLADVNYAARHHLESVIPILYQKACYGDPGEILRGVFKNSVYDIASRDEEKVIHYAVQAYKSIRNGTRYWAVYSLSFFKDLPQAHSILVDALLDSEHQIRSFAEYSLT
ncbi:hypothetical protein WBJ53_04875 [Spirosoma sp. SC4-14]|uniref:hypothetical protein n=1 Tax=Spirosoma sp. SC4-14 TaxID=3128900 RepID=UPI0030CFF5DF